MRLLIISGMAHYNTRGQVAGWGPTVREIDCMGDMFTKVTHIARLYKEKAPKSSLPYKSSRIHFIPIRPTGGARLRDKLKILFALPGYIKTILRHLPEADVVHVRCPDNISLVAIVLLTFLRRSKKIWIKYAGNWQNYNGEALSYRFQKWWLRKNFAKAEVTINGEWPNQPKYIHSFSNPCLTEKECEEAALAAKNKVLKEPIRCVFAGRLEEAKGVGRIIEIAQLLKAAGIDYQMDLIGDGSERKIYEARVIKVGLERKICFHGWLPRTALGNYYAKAHFQLLPSAAEGWPKVLSEGMAYGVVPLASNVGSIPQYLNRFQTGKAFKFDRADHFAEKMADYLKSPELWKAESVRAVQAAKQFTYEKYVERLSAMLNLKPKE